MWLTPMVLAMGLAQASASPVPQPTSPQSKPVQSAEPRPLDEVIVTAPKGPEPEPPVYGVLTGAGGRQFQAEGQRKQQMRRYRDTGSMKDYPGIRCAIFHRC